MTVGENLDMGGHRLADDARAERREWLFELFPVLKEQRGPTAATGRATRAASRRKRARGIFRDGRLRAPPSGQSPHVDRGDGR
jgi:hypothetical protein